MNYFSHNIDTVRSHFPHYYARMHDAPRDCLRVLTCKNGDMSAEYQGQLLHSQRDPRREAERIAKRVSEETPPDCDALICLGFGLGYHIEALLQQNTTLPIIVIEPRHDILASSLCIRDYQNLLKGKNFHLLSCKEQELIPFFESLQLQFPQFHFVQSFSQLYDAELVQKFHSAVDRYRLRNELNRNTLARFGQRWTRNIINNLHLVHKSSGIEALFSLFSGSPCLVCAAGPSLDEDVELLRACHQRMPLLAVDTAFTLLEQKGIHADFLLVMEPQYLNSRHLDQGCPDNTILVSDTASYPRVFRLCNNATLIFTASFFPLGQYFDPPNREKIGAGGSVASSAWDLARLLGSQEIYLAGLDLSFPGYRTHARGAAAERILSKRETRLNRLEGQYVQYLYSGMPLLTRSMAGDKILSDHRMRLYRWWFEAQFRSYPGIKNYLLSPNSGELEGSLQAERDAIYQLPIRRSEINKKIETFVARQREESQLHSLAHSEIEKKREHLLLLLEEILLLSEEGVRLSKILIEQPPRDVKNILVKLDDLEQRISQLSTKEILGFLMQQSIHDILKNKEKSDAYKNTLLLHQALLQSANKQIAFLRKKM